MSWQDYVRRHVAGRSQVSVAQLTGVSQAAVSRWLKGTQGVDAAKAIEFARAVDDEPLNALVAAGFLTATEAKARPALEPDLTQLTNRQLLELVASRMRDEGSGSDGASMNAELLARAVTVGANSEASTVLVVGEAHTPEDLDLAARNTGRKSRGQTAREAQDLDATK